MSSFAAEPTPITKDEAEALAKRTVRQVESELLAEFKPEVKANILAQIIGIFKNIYVQREMGVGNHLGHVGIERSITKTKIDEGRRGMK